MSPQSERRARDITLRGSGSGERVGDTEVEVCEAETVQSSIGMIVANL
jgi:hypothetical protein